VAVLGQASNFALRIGSMVIVARLVTPEHFGLVGMVTALTGFLGLFRDAGLSQATIQRPSITTEQTSTLFWINVLAGAILTALTAAAAPFVSWFYGDPRLIWITIALGATFFFNGASAQHRAVLQREMRFGVLGTIEFVSLLASVVTAVWMARAGMGYWALVMVTAGLPLFTMLGVWLAAAWVPGMPSRSADIRSMLHYGGLVTLNSVVMYLGNNLEKVLLGRIWGAEILGVYGRAYQLINLPGENLNSTLGTVMFPALSRVQNDPARLRSYFLKGYALFMSIVAPITVSCGLLAHDIIFVMLGSQWSQAVPIFQLLAPTILASASISPFGCLMQATGNVVRSLYISLVITPVVILGYTIGLYFGPHGVAIGFSASTLVLVLPVMWWARQGTMITISDTVRTAAAPLSSSLVGALAAASIGNHLVTAAPLVRLVVQSLVLFGVHAAVLLAVFGQWRMMREMLSAAGLRRQPGIPADISNP
jgi:O-antigen/teichoic acid export membrane protein